MKESLAAERGECLDRMDRRALRERMAIERQQVRNVFKINCVKNLIILRNIVLYAFSVFFSFMFSRFYEMSL